MDHDFELHPLSTTERLAVPLLTQRVKNAAIMVDACSVPASPGQVEKLRAVVAALKGHVEGVEAPHDLPEPCIGPRDVPAAACYLDEPACYDLAYTGCVWMLMSRETREVLADLGDRCKGAMRDALDKLERAVRRADVEV